jgi:hypothetical protein
VIGFIGLLLWGKAFVMPPPMPVPEGPVPFYSLLYSLLHDLPHLATLTGFILVIFETWWLNILLNEHELVLKNSSLAALIFIILISSDPIYLTIHPLNISIFLLIIVLNNLMKTYSRLEDLDLVYAAGFFTAIGSLFYFPFLILFAIIPVTVVLFRSGKWREWAAGFIGFFTPYFFLAVYYFVSDRLLSQLTVYEKMISGFFLYPIHLHYDDYFLGIFTTILAIWGLYYMLRGPMEKTAEIRAKTYIFLWLILITILSVAYSTTLVQYHPLLIFPSLTLMLTSTFLGIRKKRWAEIIFLIYFLLILVNSYFYNPD